MVAKIRRLYWDKAYGTSFGAQQRANKLHKEFGTGIQWPPTNSDHRPPFWGHNLNTIYINDLWTSTTCLQRSLFLGSRAFDCIWCFFFHVTHDCNFVVCTNWMVQLKPDNTVSVNNFSEETLHRRRQLLIMQPLAQQSCLHFVRDTTYTHARTFLHAFRVVAISLSLTLCYANWRSRRKKCVRDS